MPRARNASPWSRRIALASIVLVVLLAPLWIDPLTLNVLRGAPAATGPLPAETLEPGGSRPRSTENAAFAWHVISNSPAIDSASWLPIGGQALSGAVLPAATAHDVQVAFTAASTDPAQSLQSMTGAVLRRTADGSAYFAGTSVAADGSLTLSVSLISPGRIHDIAVPVVVDGVTAVAGEPLRMRAEVTGIDPATINVRVWPAATAEPAYWQMSVVDWTGVLQHDGAPGIAWRTSVDGGLASTISDVEIRSADEGSGQ